MKSLDTQILSKHLPLIQTFFMANNFYDTQVLRYNNLDVYGTQELIRIFYSETHEQDITFMALRHSGVQNMLDHFLLKCGIGAYDIHATEILNTMEAMEIAIQNR